MQDDPSNENKQHSDNGALEMARRYAAIGWHVFPVHNVLEDGTCSCRDRNCRSPGKHPRPSTGLKAATTNFASITEWFTRWPHANVGVRTGAVSGIWVLDVDPRHGGGVSLEKLVAEHGALPETVYAVTGGNGNHYIFTHSGTLVRNSVAFIPGLDVRGDDACIVVEPSNHKSGGVYRWVPGCAPWQRSAADAPTWLVELIESSSQSNRKKARTTSGAATEGGRNDRLMSLAGKLRRQGLEVPEIAAALKVANKTQCVPPLDDSEVDDVAASVGRYDAGADKAGAAERLVEIGLGAELFHDQHKVPHAAIRDDRGLRVLEISSRDFRRWLVARYYADHKKPPACDLDRVRDVLEAQALYEGKRVSLANRVAKRDGAIWIDMADERGRAIRVSPIGWEVVEQPPILFRRFQHQRALPEPARGGDAKRLLEHINIAEQDQRILFLCSTIVAFVPEINQPVLVMHGGQGSAKTTAARLRRSVVDPSEMSTVVVKQQVDEVVQALGEHHMPIFDNLGTLPAWFSDLLCQAATGGALMKRRLFSNNDSVIIAFRLPVVLTGINLPATAPDLLDRAVLIELEPIAKDRRREEAAVLAAFEADLPGILGGALDALVRAMGLYATLTIERLPRMADFARWGAAVAMALDIPFEQFLGAIERNAETQQNESLEHPVAQLLLEFASEHRTWIGTPTELFDDLEIVNGKSRSGDGWPRNAQQLSRRLNILKPALASAGVLVTSAVTHGDARKVTIEDKRPPRPRRTRSAAPGLPTPESAPKESSQDASDASDHEGIRGGVTIADAASDRSARSPRTNRRKPIRAEDGSDASSADQAGDSTGPSQTEQS